jgi:hypothetical protein
MTLSRSSFVEWQRRRSRLSHDRLKNQILNGLDAFLIQAEMGRADLDEWCEKTLSCLGEVLSLIGDTRRDLHPFHFFAESADYVPNLPYLKEIQEECDRWWDHHFCKGQDLWALAALTQEALRILLSVQSESAARSRRNALDSLRNLLFHLIQKIDSLKFTDTEYRSYV